MKSLLDSIATGSISDETLQLLKKNTVIRRISKGHILLRQGDMESVFYFVKSGCLRSYAVDEKNKEHIFMFAPEGWIISDIHAFVNDKPATLFIDAIEDSEIEICNKEFFSKTITPIQETITRLNKRISVLQKRIVMLMSSTLQERYLDFLETYPDIVQRVPQKMIASYLGVTPEALSKVRGDLSKHK